MTPSGLRPRSAVALAPAPQSGPHHSVAPTPPPQAELEALRRDNTRLKQLVSALCDAYLWLNDQPRPAPSS